MREYILKRSKRKTLSIEIDKNCNITVKAPLKLSKEYIENYLKQKEDWIEKTIEKQSIRFGNYKEPTAEEIKILRQKAKDYIPPKVKYYAEIMGTEYGSIKITSARTRFGSCSGNNNLCFSLYLMEKDEYAIDYVIVHELAHTVHHNHSKEFYKEIEKYMPDYKQREKVLKGF